MKISFVGIGAIGLAVFVTGLIRQGRTASAAMNPISEEKLHEPG